MHSDLNEQNVIKASAQFWEQMLAMTLEPVQGGAGMSLDAQHVRAMVELSGVWNGSVEIRLDLQLARQATAAMMMQPLEEVGEADTVDASKEIANMIAGVIKSSLPRPCSMTVPTAVMAKEPFASGASTCDLLAVPFRHASGTMLVRIVERECMAESGMLVA